MAMSARQGIGDSVSPASRVRSREERPDISVERSEQTETATNEPPVNQTGKNGGIVSCKLKAFTCRPHRMI
jgi:hypothetical protein